MLAEYFSSHWSCCYQKKGQVNFWIRLWCFWRVRNCAACCEKKMFFESLKKIFAFKFYWQIFQFFSKFSESIDFKKKISFLTSKININLSLGAFFSSFYVPFTSPCVIFFQVYLIKIVVVSDSLILLF